MQNGNNISLSKNGESGPMGGHRNDDEDRKLFLGGLSWDTTEGDLKEYFSKYGDVENVSVKFDAVTGNPRGFGFITFVSEKTLDAVLNDIPHTIRDKQIDPKRAKSRPICKKVFVGGIDSNISEEEIRKYFSKYGKVEQVELPYDRARGKRREFVFVIFEEEMCAEVACRDPKQRIGDRDCDIKKAQPQPVAQQQKQRSQAHGGSSYGDGYGQDRYGQERSDSRPSRGRGGYNSRGGRSSSSSGYGGSSYGSSAYPETGYGSASGFYGWDGYSYGSSTSAPPSSGGNYADYYAGYYGQGYDYGRSSGDSSAYYGYAGYEGGGGDGYAAASYGSEGYSSGYPPQPSSGGKIVRGKSASVSSGYHPYPRGGPPPPH